MDRVTSVQRNLAKCVFHLQLAAFGAQNGRSMLMDALFPLFHNFTFLIPSLQIHFCLIMFIMFKSCNVHKKNFFLDRRNSAEEVDINSPNYTEKKTNNLGL